MTLHLVYSDGHALLASDRPVIKKAQRHALVDAVDVLRETETRRARISAQADAARAEARAEGLAEARAAAEARVAEAIAGFGERIDAALAARRTEIADAAYAAASAIIGAFDDGELVERMVAQTLARIDGDGPVTVAVAPEQAVRVAEGLRARANVTVEGDPDLGPTDCRIAFERGQVVASLAVQLDRLADRWGIARP